MGNLAEAGESGYSRRVFILCEEGADAQPRGSGASGKRVVGRVHIGTGAVEAARQLRSPGR